MTRRSILRLTARDPVLRKAMLEYHFPRPGQKAKAARELRALNIGRLKEEAAKQ